jgi:phosphopantothenoylcysteine synthetase/decarboxylase
MKSKKKIIVLGITGSIAAYKAAEIAGRLVKAGHDVFVAMTHGAQQFVAPLTLQTISRNPVMTDVFAGNEGWKPGHIHLADSADLLLVAPATAHCIAELAHGFAGSPISEVALATRAPILVAPAMNGKMWLHPATQANVALLKDRGAEFVGPAEGLLACGYEGIGRLWEAGGIVARAEEILSMAE